MAKSGAGDRVTPLPAGRHRCPICGKPATARHQPFCSARCADIDLGRWLKESYRVAGEERPEDAPEGETERGES
jgi:endogenous inhibitor of DNA gyrase (YacG/DUF329 family)